MNNVNLIVPNRFSHILRIGVISFMLFITGSANAQNFFVENQGQWNDEVLFRAQRNGTIIYLTRTGYSILQFDQQQWSEIVEHGHDERGALSKLFNRDDIHKLDMHHFKVRISDHDVSNSAFGEKAEPYTLNYFLDGDADGAINVGDYKSVWYKNVYPGIHFQFIIDLERFKYNIVLEPGADISNVRMLYEGLNDLRMNGEDLLLKTSLTTLTETIPLAFAINGQDTSTVGIKYELKGDEVTFKTNASFVDQRVVIDPELVFATYSGSSADNFGFTATYDEDENLYAGGITTSPDMTFNRNGRYPATTGAFQTEYGGGSGGGGQAGYGFPCDITISKYSADGSTLLFATYLGGTENEYPQSLVVDNLNQVVVFGTTFSPNFPVKSDAIQVNKKNGSDIIVTKLSANGDALIGSTFLGGDGQDGLNEKKPLDYFYADNFRGDVIVDDDGNVYAATCSESEDFPTTLGALQIKKGADQDGVVFRMNKDLTVLDWCTFLGGDGGDALYSIDFDLNGDIYISGGTMSRDMPGTQGSLGENFFGGPTDGYVAAISPDGKTVLRATYWGTRDLDQIMSLDIDDNNKVYVVGQSQGSMPVTSGVYSDANSGQFVSRFSNDLKTVEFSTVFGTGDGFPDITINAFLVDECRKIFVSGWGGGSSTKSFSSTFGLPVTPDAHQKTTDGSDFYLIVLSNNAEELIYATYFGGNRTDDHVDGGTSRFDKSGVIYQSVCASCPPGNGRGLNDFPTTPGAFAVNNLSPRCSNASFKIAFGNLNRTPRLGEKIITVAAFDTADFNYYILDQDGDSMFITFDVDQGIVDNLIGFVPADTAIGSLTKRFVLIPDCDDVGQDTIRIKVPVRDRGCPDFKDSVGEIKIIVTPPPTVDPPETICLKFNPDGTLDVSWESVPYSPYYYGTYLFKQFPDGRIEIVDSNFTNSEFVYKDSDVSNPKERDYRYFVRIKNKCGEFGDKSIEVSTTKESEAPIAVTQVLTATVIDNKNILVKWLSSTEEDFGSFDVYRHINGEKNNAEYVTTTADTFYIDKNVDVQTTSYCYSIVVNDNCGNVSKHSNPGCTVVLDGRSVPFEHDLWWTPYQEWELGVQDYTLYRSVDTGSLRPYAVTAGNELNYNDDTLDYCWGGYWYTVVAKEVDGYDETSRSNSIYLIQPPLLHVPNAFTPNGDDLNEKWGIVPVFVKEYHLQVYNRWGQRVYESTEKKVLWDGFYKEEQTANSVYIYTITYSGWDKSVHHVKGTVTVLK